MAEQRNNKWNWEVSGFEPRTWSSSSSTSLDNADYKPGAPLVRRYSISAASALAQSELSNNSVASKLQKLQDKVKVLHFVILFGNQGFELSSGNVSGNGLRVWVLAEVHFEIMMKWFGEFELKLWAFGVM